MALVRDRGPSPRLATRRSAATPPGTRIAAQPSSAATAAEGRIADTATAATSRDSLLRMIPLEPGQSSMLDLRRWTVRVCNAACERNIVSANVAGSVESPALETRNAIGDGDGTTRVWSDAAAGCLVGDSSRGVHRVGRLCGLCNVGGVSERALQLRTVSVALLLTGTLR